MATCKKCGRTPLQWKQEDNGRWWLFDPNTNMAHAETDCTDEHARRIAQEIADNANRPVINRGDRVILKGYTGTVEALTKPYAEHKIEVRYPRRRGGKFRTVIAGVKGDVFALVKWDDPAATQQFKKWVNTRNLTAAQK